MVIGTLGPGGAERQLVTLARALERRRRGQCRAVTIRDPVGNDGHHLEALSSASSLHRLTPLDLRAAYQWLDREDLEHVRRVLPPELCGDVAALMQEFRRIEPSVVHAWLDWSSIVAGLAASLLPVRRIVLSTRNVGPHNFPSLDQPFFREMYRILLRDPRVRLINNSLAGAEDYARWLDVPRESIAVIRNGVDAQQISRPQEDAIMALRSELAVAPGARLIAGVFRLSEEKQPHVFIDVAERLMAQEKDVIVVHAGSGGLMDCVREIVQRSPFSNRFRLLGRRHDVPTILSAAELCLLASRKEGTPNVLIEAQHLGCPVVATAAGGAPETFAAGRTGLLCDVGDAEGLAAAGLRILRDEPLRRSMAQRAPEFVRERFSLRRMTENTLALYD
jgi:glycosyltransferase involved in cell wall biosynthesis